MIMATSDKGKTSKRGFASMDPEQQREIAAEGGRAAHEKGTAHEFTSEEARKAGAMSHKNDAGRSKQSAGAGNKASSTEPQKEKAEQEQEGSKGRRGTSDTN
jgi:general stress protein YciG